MTNKTNVFERSIRTILNVHSGHRVPDRPGPAPATIDQEPATRRRVNRPPRMLFPCCLSATTYRPGRDCSVTVYQRVYQRRPTRRPQLFSNCLSARNDQATTRAENRQHDARVSPKIQHGSSTNHVRIMVEKWFNRGWIVVGSWLKSRPDRVRTAGK
jgi:hypothetical protein